jgi:hypothetical protein
MIIEFADAGDSGRTNEFRELRINNSGIFFIKVPFY